MLRDLSLDTCIVTDFIAFTYERYMAQIYGTHVTEPSNMHHCKLLK